VATTVPAREIDLVRGFNRLGTRQLGALDDPYLGRRPLGECRVLYEIGRDGAAARDVRARLGLDPAYLARLIGSLERDGLIEGSGDVLRLTAAGLSLLHELDRESDELAASVLAPLSGEQRERLVRAPSEVRRLLAVSMVSVAAEDPRSDDARWCLSHYFAELAERFDEHFDPGRTLPADAADLVPPAGAFLIARVGGEPAGCGALKTHAPGTVEIMRMWVDRAHRGLGIGARILDALEEQATALGHETVRLYTNRSLDEAKAMYRTRGYVEIPRYNDDPYANHWFEKRLGGGRRPAT
jgi:GNAT superfamily N-acetyltransferase/DNA-binding MarR family transcriptional regulator